MVSTIIYRGSVHVNTIIATIPGTSGTTGLVPVAMRMWSAVYTWLSTWTSLGPLKEAWPDMYSTLS